MARHPRAAAAERSIHCRLSAYWQPPVRQFGHHEKRGQNPNKEKWHGSELIMVARFGKASKACHFSCGGTSHIMHLSRIPWATILLAALTLAIAGLCLESHVELTAASNEPWRLWTGHFTHWNGDHLFWDLIVFIGLGAYCERRNRLAFLVLVIPG